MNPLSKREQSLSETVSKLNHNVTGALARLEGLYLLYKLEGELQEDLWEATLQQAKQEAFAALQQSFALTNLQHQSPWQGA